MEAILSQFELDPISAYMEMYDDTTPLMESYIKEAASGTTKKNIIQKLFDLIKKIIKLIISGIKKLMNIVKSFITGKKTSAAEAVEDLDLPVPKDVDVSATGKSGIVHDSINVVKEDGKIDQVEFTTMLDAYIKTVVDKNGAVRIEVNHGSNKLDQTVDPEKRDDFEHNRPSYIYQNLIIFLIAVNNRNLLKECFDAFSSYISNGCNDNELKILNTKYSDFRNATVKVAIHQIKFDATYFKEFMNIFTDAGDKLASIDVNNLNNSATNAFNDMAELLLRIQYGLNAVSNCIALSDRVPTKYSKCVKDVNTLDKVVLAFIKAKIPSHILSYNVAYMTSDELAHAVDISKVSQGQSRAVLLPKNDKIVYKFATNGYGRIANKDEFNASNDIEKAGFGNKIAKVLSIEKNSCVETCERASMEKRPGFNQDLNNITNIFSNKGGEYYKRSGKLIGDIHDNNVGYINNKMVVVDYAYTR